MLQSKACIWRSRSLRDIMEHINKHTNIYVLRLETLRVFLWRDVTLTKKFILTLVWALGILQETKDYQFSVFWNLTFQKDRQTDRHRYTRRTGWLYYRFIIRSAAQKEWWLFRAFVLAIKSIISRSFNLVMCFPGFMDQ